MEWLLILSLGITGVEPPPPVPYPSRDECVVVAKKIAAENNWIYFMEMGPDSQKLEPGVLRPSVLCILAEWYNRPSMRKK